MAIGTRSNPAYEIRPIEAPVLSELRRRDDAGRPPLLLADEEGGSPLRCCLRLSLPSEQVALLAYAPLRRWAASVGAVPGAYDETGPVFVHRTPCPGPAGPGIPDSVLGRRRVFRAYDRDGRILGGRLLEWGPHEAGARAHEALGELFADPAVALVHARAVEFGCFTFEARRRG